MLCLIIPYTKLHGNNTPSSSLLLAVVNRCCKKCKMAKRNDTKYYTAASQKCNIEWYSAVHQLTSSTEVIIWKSTKMICSLHLIVSHMRTGDDEQRRLVAVKKVWPCVRQQTSWWRLSLIHPLLPSQRPHNKSWNINIIPRGKKIAEINLWHFVVTKRQPTF